MQQHPISADVTVTLSDTEAELTADPSDIGAVGPQQFEKKRLNKTFKDDTLQLKQHKS